MSVINRKISNIILHCSDSDYGTAVIINRWHIARGWTGIGYHLVCLNGYAFKNDPSAYEREFDGVFEHGRSFEEIGAHAEGHNSDSIGICLIGKTSFSFQQINAVRLKIIELCNILKLSYNHVIGHYEVDTKGKTCPNIDMNLFRSYLADQNKINDLLNKNKGA